MGERSDIFVRIRVKENKKATTYKHQAFFGLYYQWCYGERMISRLRSAINYAESHVCGWHGGYACSEETVELFKRYLAINFDMQDILKPVDLVPDAVDDVMQGYDTAKADIFNQAENHGYIYLDITVDDPDDRSDDNKGATIKYAFVQGEWHNKKNPLPPVMSVEQFADWDIADNERKWYEPDPDWDREDNSWGHNHKKHFLEEIVPTAKKNIEEINKSASVMTEDERKEFVKFGRAYTRKLLKIAEKKKAENQEQREILTAEICSQEYLPAELHNKLLELVDKVYPKPQNEQNEQKGMLKI
jgi:hypothetical protein